MTKRSRHLLALDFDGVLCDSVNETAATAWRAGRDIWSHWRGAEPPSKWVDGFCRARPYLETGYQAIPMLRMVEQGCDERAFCEELEQQIDTILAETALERNDMVTRFGAARDHWIKTDEAGWLGRNRFFAGTVDRLQQRIAAGDEIFIVTTKQERFVHALLKGAGITLPEDRVFGLEHGLKKEDILSDLLSRALPITFVEDRLPTLQRVAARTDLAEITLQYAEWGYGTPAHLASASASARIDVIRLDGFLSSSL